MPWTLARRAARLEPSTIREILKVTERPGIISLAGGLPSADGFPVDAMAAACAKVLRDNPREALQYAASEGFGPLREWVAAELGTQGMAVQADQVLITTGSQQGLDLVGKVLIDPGSTVAVESPTYLGALQAFSPYEPTSCRSTATTRARCRTALDARAARASCTCCPTSRTRAGAACRRAPRRRWRPAAGLACRWSRTTPTATCGSTPRRRRR
jgi:aspartate/methionine/tyrosine aminotransferase